MKSTANIRINRIKQTGKQQKISPIIHFIFKTKTFSDANAEVDFLFSDGLRAYPLEAKAGNNVHAKSLKVYDKEYNPQLLFRTSLLPYEKNGKLINIPLYLLFALPKVLTL